MKASLAAELVGVPSAFLGKDKAESRQRANAINILENMAQTTRIANDSREQLEWNNKLNRFRSLTES
jgi:hypothetical protein